MWLSPSVCVWRASKSRPFAQYVAVVAVAVAVAVVVVVVAHPLAAAFYKITKKHDKIVKRLLEALGGAAGGAGAGGATGSGPPGAPVTAASTERPGTSGSVAPALVGSAPTPGGRPQATAVLATNLMSTFMASLEDQPFLRVLNNDR